MCQVLKRLPGPATTPGGAARESPSAVQARRPGRRADQGQVHGESQGPSTGQPAGARRALSRPRGVACCVNTVARLMRRARRCGPPRRGGTWSATRPTRSHGRAVAENTLDRRFKPGGGRTGSGWPTSPTWPRTKAGCTWRRCWTCIAEDRGLVHGRPRIEAAGRRCLEMALAARRPGGADPARSSDRGCSTPATTTSGCSVQPRHLCSMSRKGELLGQRPDGELLRHTEDGTGASERIRHPRRGTGRSFEYFEVFYNRTPPLFPGLPVPRRFEASRINR